MFIDDYGPSGPHAVALEDSIMVQGRPVTAGSKILQHFTAPLTATVAMRLEASGYHIAGKTHMDEFGLFRMDAPEAAGEAETLGAVQAVASGRVGFALCNDLFGKYARQAAQAGLCSIRPTYGTVSRYGLIPLAASMDQIGLLCPGPEAGFELLAKLAGQDDKDGAMFPEAAYAYEAADNVPRLAVPSAFAQQPEVQKLAALFPTVPVELPHFALYKQVLTVLSCGEISNNLSRYDGIKFGHRAQNFRGLNDLYIQTRSEALGPDAKRTAILGAWALSQDQYTPYYDKALRLRRLIKEGLAFDTYDVLVLPGQIPGDAYENLSLYALPALAGLPAVAFRFQHAGLQLVGPPKGEGLLRRALQMMEGGVC